MCQHRVLQVSLALVAVSVAAQSPERGRPMVPSDILSIRSYGETQFSPDGRYIAVEVRGSRNDDSSRIRIDYVTRSDLWVVRRDGSGRRRVVPDGSSTVSTWHPVWSPTGRYLAFLYSTRHRNAFVEVWDRQTGLARRISTGPVDLAAAISKGTADYRHPLCWLDDSHLVVVTLPHGAQALAFHEDVQTLEIERRGLASVNAGDVPTVVVTPSPADSGPQPSEPSASLLVLDVRNGATRHVGDMPATQTRAAKQAIVISNNGRWAAIVVHLHPASLDPQVGWTVPSVYPARLGIASMIEGRSGVHWVGGVSPYTGITSTYILPFSWTATDSTLAFMSIASDQSTSHPRGKERLDISLLDPTTLELHSVASWTTRRVDDDPLEPVGLTWTIDGRLEMRTRSSALWVVSRDSVFPAADDTTRAQTPPRKTSDLELHISPDGRLSATDSSGESRTLFPPINPQLDAIAGPRYVPLQYTTVKGDTLHATALLPYNYVPDRRYPVVVWVYAGNDGGTKDAPIDRFAERDDDFFLNLLPLSGHGYVVLKPSIPVGPLGVASDPMLQSNAGVDPAVDSLVAMGIADSTRVALMGHSYGGYTVFGLLTQTHRYKTAIAMMGMVDLISDYGTFDQRHVYTEPNEAAVGPWYYEKGQGRMGAPLWRDPQRYLRNSPLLSADKIDTPVLIVGGSMDLSITQNEEMFSALYRLGRRAEMITYIGETHTLESPANIVDLWSRMFRWLDRYLAPDNR